RRRVTTIWRRRMKGANGFMATSHSTAPLTELECRPEIVARPSHLGRGGIFSVLVSCFQSELLKNPSKQETISKNGCKPRNLSKMSIDSLFKPKRKPQGSVCPVSV